METFSDGFLYLCRLLTGRCSCHLKFTFKLKSRLDIVEHFLRNCPLVNATGRHWCLVNIGSGNGLVSSWNEPLSEPMLTQIYMLPCGITRPQWPGNTRNQDISRHDIDPVLPEYFRTRRVNEFVNICIQNQLYQSQIKVFSWGSISTKHRDQEPLNNSWHQSD